MLTDLNSLRTFARTVVNNHFPDWHIFFLRVAQCVFLFVCLFVCLFFYLYTHQPEITNTTTVGRLLKVGLFMIPFIKSSLMVVTLVF